MSVEEVRSEFFTIADKVYQPHGRTPSERTRKLKECIEDFMERKGHPINMKLLEELEPGQCAR
jgi:xylose isomerase